MTDRTILLATETYAPTINGVAISVRQQSKVLREAGYLVRIIAPRHAKAKEELAVYRVPSIQLPNPHIYPLTLPLSQLTLATEYKTALKGVELIHLQHISFLTVALLIYAKRHRLPTIYTYHTLLEHYLGRLLVINFLIRPILRWLTKTFANQTDQIIVPTKSVKRYLKELGVKTKITVVPTGIEVQRYRRGRRSWLEAKHHIPNDKLIISYVGRLAQEKNVDLIPTALAPLAEREDWHLLMVGDGPARATLEHHFAVLNLSDRVTFTGFVPPDEVMRYFGISDIFIYPSPSDTQAIVVCEALAAGAVPLVGDAWGPADIVDDGITGYVLDLKAEEFTGKIALLLDRGELLLKLRRKASQASLVYDRLQTSQQLLQVYADTFNRHRPR